MTSAKPRQLIVMRHAKTEPTAHTDHARQLTQRGRADAREAGRLLASEGDEPSVALVSSAVRAQQTYEELVAGLGSQPVLQTSAEMYGADAEDVLRLCRALSPEVDSAVVIGHNPTMEALVHGLQETPAEEWPEHLPTSGVVVFAIAGAWADMEAGTATVLRRHVPRG